MAGCLAVVVSKGWCLKPCGVKGENATISTTSDRNLPSQFSENLKRHMTKRPTASLVFCSLVDQILLSGILRETLQADGRWFTYICVYNALRNLLVTNSTINLSDQAI
ncbi:hypothetical protein AJ80_05370 [Polytolypa hystricis UAMH7299]|uniref:Uncharacterized protein n=1 Tax=Polytolypa hystricis (strain UAMH7299) TaxID=1447883 RepID=A0A2B7XW44_POLH7|nr:hypothetical protein AJ80_05370 [Polytolypa hystricis UAMH7299]